MCEFFAVEGQMSGTPGCCTAPASSVCSADRGSVVANVRSVGISAGTVRNDVERLQIDAGRSLFVAREPAAQLRRIALQDAGELFFSARDVQRALEGARLRRVLVLHLLPASATNPQRGCKQRTAQRPLRMAISVGATARPARRARHAIVVAGWR